MKVYIVNFHDLGAACFDSLDEAIADIAEHSKELEAGDSMTVDVTVEEMTQEEFNALDDFTYYQEMGS